MGRNGAGKSTLLRAAAGLLEPTHGRVATPAGVALLPQRPADLLVRERVGDELPAEAGRAALELLGLGGLADADPATSRAASASAWRWRSWSRAVGAGRGSRPALCCRTSRPAAWTAPARTTCPLSRPSSPGPARRSWSRPTTSSLPPPSPTGSC